MTIPISYDVVYVALPLLVLASLVTIYYVERRTAGFSSRTIFFLALSAVLPIVGFFIWLPYRAREHRQRPIGH